MCYDYVFHFLNKLNYTILMVNEFVFILFLSLLYIYINLYLLVDLYNLVYKNKFYFVLLLDFFFTFFTIMDWSKGNDEGFFEEVICVYIYKYGTDV